jgi:hypothetical protein
MARGGTRNLAEVSKIAAKYGYVLGGITSKHHIRWVRSDGTPGFILTGNDLTDKRALQNMEPWFRRGPRITPREMSFPSKASHTSP